MELKEVPRGQAEKLPLLSECFISAEQLQAYSALFLQELF